MSPPTDIVRLNSRAAHLYVLALLIHTGRAASLMAVCSTHMEVDIFVRAVDGLLQVAEFYKSWDLYGALSNFSAHPISMPSGAVSISGALPSASPRQWHSVEHFYQAQKFAGQSLLCL